MKTLLDEREAFLGFLARRTGDQALAEDLLHDAFARSLDRLDTLRDEESAVAWFYRVLRNAVIDHRRRHATAAKALDGLAAELDASPANAPEALHAAVCRCVAGLADTLKPEYAAVLRRVEVEEVSVKDYAAEAGITPNNAAVRAFRAREALRARVKECCGRCADAGCVDCTCPPHEGAG
jgi:RNA polymerase sigma-70 factor (ECF subfamily)